MAKQLDYGSAGDGKLAALCWCEARYVAATHEQVRDGVRLSCPAGCGDVPAPAVPRNRTGQIGPRKNDRFGR